MSKWKSRKLWVAVAGIILNVLVAQGLIGPELQTELMTLITIVVGVYIGGQSVDDAVTEAHKEKVIEAETEKQIKLSNTSRL